MGQDDAPVILLREALLEAEEVLRSLSLGVSATVRLDGGVSLTFGRFGVLWCLRVLPSALGKPVVVLDTSLEVQVQVAKAIPALVGVLREAYERKNLGKVAQELEDFLWKLRVSSIKSG